MMFAALLGVLAERSRCRPTQMSDWGWRIPFLVGCLIVPFLFLHPPLAAGDRGIPAPRKHRPTIARDPGARSAQNWRDRAARHDAGHDDHGLVLHDHRLHADLRQERAASRRASTAWSSPLCVGLSNLFWLPVMGALSDRIGRRPLLLVFTVLTLAHRLSGAVLAGRRAVVRAPAVGRAVAVVPLRQLQRRHGGVPDRDHAGAGAHGRLLAGLQPRHGDLRRLHAGVVTS